MSVLSTARSRQATCEHWQRQRQNPPPAPSNCKSICLGPCFKTKSRRHFKIVQPSQNYLTPKLSSPASSIADVDIRYDEKTGALVIESKLTLDPLAEAPSIPGDVLDSRLLEDPSFVEQFMKSEFEGSIPDHLAFSVKPTIVQDEDRIDRHRRGQRYRNECFRSR
jgi:hypothetical protein